MELGEAVGGLIVAGVALNVADRMLNPRPRYRRYYAPRRRKIVRRSKS